MKKICIVTTMWSSINNWIKPFLDEYHKRGVEVTIVCNMDEEYEQELKKEFPYIQTYAIDFPRGINVGESIKSILKLRKLFGSKKFDMVQYSTPNASMYAAIASWLTRIPVRLYCQWGMVYVTMTGIKRKIFKNIEKMICKCSTEVQPDSQGNLLFCREQGFYDETNSRVIWNGSAKGLDLSSFNVQEKEKYATEIKTKYKIGAQVPVIGFVGRLGKEKGCNELLRAFQKIKIEFADAKLLFVGPIEKEDTIEPELLRYFYDCDDIIKTDRVTNVEKYMAAMDVFILPSYREGFGMSVIEASAMEIPVIVTKYPGPSSAVEEGVTGYLVGVKEVDPIVKYVKELLANPEKAKEMGCNARKYVEEKFEQQTFIQKYMENRMQLLKMDDTAQ